MNNTTKKLPFSLLHAESPDARIIILTAIHASLIPLIISANLLLIFGIIKTKRNNFTSSQILFLTLFLSDLTFGLVQLPLQIYVNWNSFDATYFEIGSFFLILPICLSGTILSMISIDRYIIVVHNKYYRRLVTNKLLSVTIALAILVSVIWATGVVLDTLRTERFFTAMLVYTGAVLAIGVVFNVALLKNVKQKTKNSSIHQALDSSLTKTVSLILATLVAAYMPLMIVLTITSCGLIDYIPFIFTLIPTQVNAVLNSVIYFARNSRIRRYYYKLFNAINKRKYLTKPSVLGFSCNRRCQLTVTTEFYIKAKPGNSNFYRWYETICKCFST